MSKEVIDFGYNYIKNNVNKKYYNMLKVLNFDADYFILISERSNGKTYSVKVFGISRALHNQGDIGIIRRYDLDYKNTASEMFNDVLDVIERESNGRWNNVYYYGKKWYFCKYEDGKRVETDSKPFAYGFYLNGEEHVKSVSYPTITTILFDEFITRNGYLDEELIKFTSIISTIVRLDTIRFNVKIKIFMCGNTINKYCPYFRDMGLKHVTQQKQGTIDEYKINTKSGDVLRVAVEYIDSLNNKSSKPSNKFFAFDNPKLTMITDGKWEVAIYPHLPVKYERTDVLYSYVIYFDDDMVQGDIIQKDNMLFTYFHRKTSKIDYDLALKDNRLIFQESYSPYPNVRRKITKPTNELEKKIAKFFVRDKVFYQDNEIGEIVSNYIKWCGSSI
jgi:hypothetical protein